VSGVIFLNVTTEDGELIERVTVELSDDREHPIGTSYGKAWVVSEIESAARIVLARQAS
jgi:hypothetical protein